ncbi:Planctomycete cytochrome C [Thalassoglobus neptunius]|uniref:Planctomycete cytochrome C n=1 Tax=Thalassoglobus neptunius TaxID=1938619 RepID=A0A5C5X895_9PLAN|nr:PSD1 and planctomycete cytochrome C domain-containing protein [Thalassoglobus neptunius]TWT59058.1 Planctomycete cytochrome C [Thalassoglobus neptunius]
MLLTCKTPLNRFCSLLLTAVATLSLVSSGNLLADEKVEFFESKIRPALIEHCYRCHSQEYSEAKGGLTVDTRNGIRRGGDSGPAVVPGKTDESLLVEAINYESFEMPPKSKLPPETIAHFEKWIAMGAPDPRDETVDPIVARKAAEIDWEEARQHWSFQSPQQTTVPDETENRIDYFVDKRLAEEDIQPNRPADDKTLLRRLYFDLIGLPPTIEESQEFFELAKVDRNQALRTTVNKLLNSPRFGEHWATLWLDISRYAEDQAHIVGNNKALFFPNAYRYRDWVIQAFNLDLPYDQFIKLQLAADLLTPEDVSDDAALGFIGLGPKYYRRSSPEVMADEWEDRVDVVSRGLLGLTVACARCHDHKFDPIPTEDYYALAGVFASTEMWNRPIDEAAEVKKDGHAEDPEQALHIIRDKNVHDLNVLIRGDINTKGEIVPRRYLQVLSEGTPQPYTQGSGRLELADQIASLDNPLTARVIVNRIWAAYFGAPLVSTPSNFGHLGTSPSHPQLLDDLAFRFMENGWSLKWLHNEIVTSNAYQRSSDLNEKAMAADEANINLWRMNRQRMTVEQWRDAVLSATGQLESAIGGPSMEPDSLEELRRTVYSVRSRFELNPLLAMFDFPDPNAHSARRVETTTPLQKLFVLNSPFMVAQADKFQQRILNSAETEEEQIDLAYQILFHRKPEPDEKDLAQKFLATADWTQFAQVLLASNEFLIID